MTRLALSRIEKRDALDCWIAFSVAGLLYNLGKLLLGFEANWSDFGQSVYWSGLTLFVFTCVWGGKKP